MIFEVFSNLNDSMQFLWRKPDSLGLCTTAAETQLGKSPASVIWNISINFERVSPLSARRQLTLLHVHCV